MIEFVRSKLPQILIWESRTKFTILGSESYSNNLDEIQYREMEEDHDVGREFQEKNPRRRTKKKRYKKIMMLVENFKRRINEEEEEPRRRSWQMNK